MKKLGKPKPKKGSKKPAKPKRALHGVLRKRAHSIIRDIVLLRDGRCVCPPPQNGHSAVRQAGHIIPSVKGGSRFSLWNVHEQCSSCNGRHTSHWYIYEGWFIDKFGNDRWNLVRDESRNDGLKTPELEELIVQLDSILDRIKAFPEWKPYFTQNEILTGEWK